MQYTIRDIKPLEIILSMCKDLQVDAVPLFLTRTGIQFQVMGVTQTSLLDVKLKIPADTFPTDDIEGRICLFVSPLTKVIQLINTTGCYMVLTYDNSDNVLVEGINTKDNAHKLNFEMNLMEFDSDRLVPESLGENIYRFNMDTLVDLKSSLDGYARSTVDARAVLGSRIKFVSFEDRIDVMSVDGEFKETLYRVPVQAEKFSSNIFQLFSSVILSSIITHMHKLKAVGMAMRFTHNQPIQFQYESEQLELNCYAAPLIEDD